MKTELYLLVYLFLIFGACQNSSPKENNLNDEEQVGLSNALEKFNTAFAHSNLAVLDSMTTENYLHSNGHSKAITKSDWFNYLKKRDKNIKSGAIKVLDYRLEETKIEHHGNTAMVTGKVIVKTMDSLGKKQNQYRITNLWVYENGQWKRAGFHDGKID